MKNVALHNLGCKVNSYELDAIQQMLQEKGYKIVPFDTIADIYIINTCTVTNIADRKSRQMLHRAKKKNPNAIVVATGCYVQTGLEQIEKDPCIDLAVGNNRKKDFIAILEEYLQEYEMDAEETKEDKTLGNTTVLDINHTNEYEEMQLHDTADHTRAYIKIQDGCNQFCSYCIIPFARGRVRSRSEADILKEIKGLVASGHLEIVITGIHISSYGTDKTTEKIAVGDYKKQQGFLLELLRKIQQIEGLERIRIGSLEPRIITEEFAEELSKLDKICPHFHLSLQSGSDSVLKRMNRYYDTKEFAEKVNILRKVYEHPAITTDIIVGFPGETQEEFMQTQKYLEEIDLYEMHIFKYSVRKGTVAAKMEGQLTDAEKAVRSDVLEELEKKQSKKFREYYLGKTVEVLLEEEHLLQGKKYLIGHTKDYVKVAVLAELGQKNHIVRGKAETFLQDDILLLCEPK